MSERCSSQLTLFSIPFLFPQVSDARAFGTGGTSVAAQVGTSSDSSCFDPSKNVSPDFVFSIEPPNQVVQCQPMRIWWDPATVKGCVLSTILGVRRDSSLGANFILCYLCASHVSSNAGPHWSINSVVRLIGHQTSWALYLEDRVSPFQGAKLRRFRNRVLDLRGFRM